MKIVVKECINTPITPDHLASGDHEVELVSVNYEIRDGVMYLIRTWEVLPEILPR